MLNEQAIIASISEHFKVPPGTIGPFEFNDEVCEKKAMFLVDSRPYMLTVRPCALHIDEKLTRSEKERLKNQYELLKYIDECFRIPVPEAIMYRHDAAVGAEWMVRSHIPGRPLPEVWVNMTSEEKRKVCIRIGEIWATLLSKRWRNDGIRWACDYDSSKGGLLPLESLPERGTGRWSSIGDMDFLVQTATVRRKIDGVWTPVAPHERADVGAVVSRIRTAPILASDHLRAIRNFAIEHPEFRPDVILVDSSDYSKVTGVVGWEYHYMVPVYALRFWFFKDRNRFGGYAVDVLNVLIMRVVYENLPELRLLTSTDAVPLFHLYNLALRSRNWRKLGLNINSGSYIVNKQK
ncbi:hypothetical protein GLOTRDRAFT_140547 [Gloeophyllum trabeum ATCC 11539]|uniref:Aminoglycoside phosphotransferase domain-containing protein n=1 Tax=Gloeophyllum trabeum (strain ATCC 11539 / FP-39264 / Madison 617) TaxID=670483 RepID=S7RD30_GLOTA|nr:uncharacterized protein GLOTRDRAFT_140547 [Gloeophyllum trabeum ATCC 11539]EPQ52110.1 hypothetical protein GLOTRDRAFT_140547 [Gloeophyllum trabeum ATCC 11539]